eukprot:gene7470-8299_t
MASRRRQNNSAFSDDVDYSSDPAMVIYKIGIYGWRKRCLYFLILLILILGIINLALVIWVIRVQDFSFDGMGRLRITKNGVILEGPAEFVKTLKAKYIMSRKDAALNIQSMKNVTLSARDANNKITGQIHVGNEEVVVKSKRMRILDEAGKNLLYADKDKLEINVQGVEFVVPDGLRFDKSIQTPLVSAGEKQILFLESPTKTLFMNAAQGIKVTSVANDIKIDSLYNIELASKSGKIVMNSSSVIFNNLKASDVTGTLKTYPNAREVCMCADGSLFLAPATGTNRCLVTSGVC